VTWWDVADPARAVPRVARDLPAVDGIPGPVVFTPDGRRMFVTAGTSPGVVWDTSDPASPTLLTTVPPTSGSEAYGAVLRGPALVLSGQGAASVWDVADPAAASEAAVLDSGDENAFFFDHLALTRNGLLAATHFAEGTASYYTREALIRLYDLRPILDVIADPVAAACRITGHDLRANLWRQHAPDVETRPICP
jgi:hypothetical protein